MREVHYRPCLTAEEECGGGMVMVWAGAASDLKASNVEKNLLENLERLKSMD